MQIKQVNVGALLDLMDAIRQAQQRKDYDEGSLTLEDLANYIEKTYGTK